MGPPQKTKPGAKKRAKKKFAVGHKIEYTVYLGTAIELPWVWKNSFVVFFRKTILKIELYLIELIEIPSS